MISDKIKSGEIMSRALHKSHLHVRSKELWPCLETQYSRDRGKRRLCAHIAYAKGECEDEQGRITKKKKNKIIIGITDQSLYFKR